MSAGLGRQGVALNLLEDAGFFCIDNVPAAFWIDDSQLVAARNTSYENLAFGVDLQRRRRPRGHPGAGQRLRSRTSAAVIFLHADEDVLLKRYAESRRPHPLSSEGLSLREAIAREKELLGPVIASAELIIDTTHTSVYQLRDAVRGRVALKSQPVLSILIESFGYRSGVPLDADFVFDLRCLPNPYWDVRLRPFTGRDEPVIRYLDAQEGVQQMLQDISAFLERWIPKYIDFNRNYLTVALGCTGGQHRSVYMAEKIGGLLAGKYPQVLIRHNELRGIGEPALRHYAAIDRLMLPG
jgi:UPF0042 nucleotide-binding protein